jgi:transcriptional regulator with XRE-family HTH domain
MDVGFRLKQLREWRKFSQGKIEKRTGLLRCYISRVENGHTVPSIETLEKMARALEVQMYQLFFSDNENPNANGNGRQRNKKDWASPGKGSRMLAKFVNSLGAMSEQDRALFLYTAEKIVQKRHGR